MSKIELLDYISRTFDISIKMWRLISHILDFVDESEYEALKEHLDMAEWSII